MFLQHVRYPLFLAVVACSFAGSPSASQAQMTASLQLAMGNPSNAVTDTGSPENYLISRPQYALCYSNTKRIPKWVSWHLAKADLGSATRTTSFYADTALPSGWTRITDGDYTGSGFDRGHNCPSADRTLTSADNKALFYMTNIWPQQADNNQGPWEALETYCRNLTSSGKELYIITSWDTTNGTIASGKVTVPKYVNKCFVVLSDNGAAGDAARVTSSTPTCGLTMPNAAGIRSNSWTQYITTVNAIEGYTGIKFFTACSSSVQTAIKSKVYVP